MTGVARATTTEIARQTTTAEIARRQVARRATTGRGSDDDRLRVRRRQVADRATTGPTPRARVAATIYKGGKLVRDSRSD